MALQAAADEDQDSMRIMATAIRLALGAGPKEWAEFMARDQPRAESGDGHSLAEKMMEINRGGK